MSTHCSRFGSGVAFGPGWGGLVVKRQMDTGKHAFICSRPPGGLDLRSNASNTTPSRRKWHMPRVCRPWARCQRAILNDCGSPVGTSYYCSVAVVAPCISRFFHFSRVACASATSPAFHMCRQTCHTHHSASNHLVGADAHRASADSVLCLVV